jgi:hypothetical protein
MALTVVALVAVGAHSLSLTAPALAQQDRERLAAEAAAEHAVVPHAPPAASDGLPVPILVAGIVVAFAVGLSGGYLHRRRRIKRVDRIVATSPAPVPVADEAREPQPPPTPPKPPAVEQKPVALAPPPRREPAPEPPPTKAPAPRVVEPPAPPVQAPPEPPRREAPARPAAAEPLRLVRRAPAPAPQPAPAAEAPLAEAPEVPRPQADAAASVPTPPLTEAPEAVGPPPSAEAPAPQPPPPAAGRRFARVAHWPEEAAELWTCELDWKAGYRKAAFRAMAGAPGAKRRSLGESVPLKWALMSEPEPATPELAIRVRALVEALEAAGWEHIGRGRHWYEQRFLWRGSGEPQPISLAGAEPAER